MKNSGEGSRFGSILIDLIRQGGVEDAPPLVMKQNMGELMV